ncbi:MAG: WhiB family transcriptional regulator [Egibacteraceae bacterium]
MFFPIGSTGPALDQAERAKAVCVDCPVRVECREWALATGQHDGVWGGLTEDERRQLRRQRGRQARQS